MKTKITLSLAGLLVSFLTPLAVLVPQASAIADTCTWTGDSLTSVVDSDLKTITYNMNDMDNWTGCDNTNTPESGDALVFPTNQAIVDPGDALTDDSQWKYVVNNDFVGASYSSITFSGDGAGDCSTPVYDDIYNLRGLALTVTGNIVDTATNTGCSGSSSIDLEVDVTSNATISADFQSSSILNYGTNDITLSSTSYKNFYGELNGSGDITLGGINFYPQSTSVFGNSVTVATDTSIYIQVTSPLNDSDKTITFNDGATFNFAGSSATANHLDANLVFVGDGTDQEICLDLNVYPCPAGREYSQEGYRGSLYVSSYDSESESNIYYDAVINGDITLSNDTLISIERDTEIKGDLSGAFTIAPTVTSKGSLTVNSTNNESSTANGVQKSAGIDVDLYDLSYTGTLYIYSGYRATLTKDNEIANEVLVQSGATLKGEGEVAGLTVETGAILAPGNSPGCISSTAGLTLSGTYEVEIAGTTVCTGYDQTDVTGAVDVTGGTLNVSILDDFVPALNDVFIIIKNDAADAVTGEFTDLAEGANVVLGSVTYQISYEGGDGNDVVLTATAVPTAVTTPDTGIGQIMQSPITTLLAVMLSAGALLVIKRIQSAK